MLIEDLEVPHSGVLVHDSIATVKNTVQIPMPNFSKRDIYVKQPLRLVVLSPPKVIGHKMKVTHEDNEISIDLNERKEDKVQDHIWIEGIDFQ